MLLMIIVKIVIIVVVIMIIVKIIVVIMIIIVIVTVMIIVSLDVCRRSMTNVICIAEVQVNPSLLSALAGSSASWIS